MQKLSLVLSMDRFHAYFNYPTQQLSPNNGCRNASLHTILVCSIVHLVREGRAAIKSSTPVLLHGTDSIYPVRFHVDLPLVS